MKCVCCNANLRKSKLKLQPSPLGDKYTKKINKLNKYPFNILECEKCNYIGIDEVADPSESYEEYLYLSNTTNGLEQEYKKYVEWMQEKKYLNNTKKILEIGCNDGLLLQQITRISKNTKGIEPSIYACEQARKRKLNIVNEYFDSDTVNKILVEDKKYDLIVANYVFANIAKLDEFIINCKKIIDSKGKIIIQTGYTPNQFQNGMFDYIYHEHLHYFSLKSLRELFSKHDLYIADVEFTTAKISSIRIAIAFKESNKEKQNKIQKIIKLEEIIYNNINKYFHIEINKNLKLVKENLKKLSEQGYKIIGYGASHSVTTLIHQMNIGIYINYIIDDNINKIKTYSPGYNIKVIDMNDKLIKNKKKIFIILAWQHSDSIEKKIKQSNVDSIVIKPFPKYIMEII
jgi:2-polyprenyl-3-methyl-5-hydroxy-6-metoxy-1,4-benzoquinol methylase